MTPDWDAPDTACVPCRGRGWITQEDATGMPGADVVCPYCRGRQNTWWVSRNRWNRVRHSRVLWLGLAVWLLWSLWPSNPAWWVRVLHFALVGLLVVAWFWLPRMRLRRRQHAPGFSGPREAHFLTGFAAAVGLRSLFDNSRRRGF